jgi:hypothetical protein
MTMKNGVFWDVTRNIPYDTLLQGFYIPEDDSLPSHRPENLKSSIVQWPWAQPKPGEPQSVPHTVKVTTVTQIQLRGGGGGVS